MLRIMNSNRNNISVFYDNSRKNFQHSIRTWFQNRGIINKLVLFVRSQMILELQYNLNQSTNSEPNISVSPKIQAVKLLIADFFLQEHLLFSLSVYCSEVPFLMNLKQYSNYVSLLANSYVNTLKQSKPKFNDANVCDILEALGLNLNLDEISSIRNMYNNGKYKSFLMCILSLLPCLLKNYRYVVKALVKTQRKEIYYKKLSKIEKLKIKRMFRARNMRYLHKITMNKIFQKHNDENYVEKISELSKKETDLTSKQNNLILKEKDFEENYRNKMEELDKKESSLKIWDLERQNNYKILQEQREISKIENDHLADRIDLIHPTEKYETLKLWEYEQKFCALQEEVAEILKKCNEKQNKKQMIDRKKFVNKCIQCSFDTTCHKQSQQTENDKFLDVEEYLDVIEKENSLLKLSWNKQRYYIDQLDNEIIFLKNKIIFLENEFKIRHEPRQETETNEVVHKINFPARYCFSEGRQSQKYLQMNRFHFRRKLFEDKLQLVSSSLSSGGNSKDDSNLTDEIVADANNKLKELENESNALNRNFKNLQNVLSRNIAFNEDKTLGYSSISDSSSGDKRIAASTSKSLSDLSNTSIIANRFRKSKITDDLKLNSREKKVSFQNLFQKYKENKKNTACTEYNTEKRENSFELDAPFRKSDDNIEVNIPIDRNPENITFPRKTRNFNNSVEYSDTPLKNGIKTEDVFVPRSFSRGIVENTEQVTPKNEFKSELRTDGGIPNLVLKNIEENEANFRPTNAPLEDEKFSHTPFRSALVEDEESDDEKMSRIFTEFQQIENQLRKERNISKTSSSYESEGHISAASIDSTDFWKY